MTTNLNRELSPKERAFEEWFMSLDIDRTTAKSMKMAFDAGWNACRVEYAETISAGAFPVMVRKLEEGQKRIEQAGAELVKTIRESAPDAEPYSFKDLFPLVDVVVDTALSTDRKQCDVHAGAMIVSWGGLEDGFVVLVIDAYDGQDVDEDEAKEIASDVLNEHFKNEGMDPYNGPPHDVVKLTVDDILSLEGAN